MNKNIEVINKYLWAVNFDYVNAGWIPNINIQNTKPDEVLCLLDGGVILINSKKSGYKDVALWTSLIMSLKNNELGSTKGFFTSIRKLIPGLVSKADAQLKSTLGKNNFEECTHVYRACCYVERKRRLLHKQAMKGR